MSSVNPKLLIALGLAIALVLMLKVINPHRQFSSNQYWAAATIESVQEVPDDALRPGNKNGSVLMWAAMNVSDPSILAALVERGADINESDPIFSGTPLTAAARYSRYPDIIDEMILLGAEIDKRVNNDEDALMIAAQYNVNSGIIEALIAHGADPMKINAQGQTALALARSKGNKVAVDALEKLSSSNAP